MPNSKPLTQRRALRALAEGARPDHGTSGRRQRALGARRWRWRPRATSGRWTARRRRMSPSGCGPSRACCSSGSRRSAARRWKRAERSTRRRSTGSWRSSAASTGSTNSCGLPKRSPRKSRSDAMKIWPTYSSASTTRIVELAKEFAGQLDPKGDRQRGERNSQGVSGGNMPGRRSIRSTARRPPGW